MLPLLTLGYSKDPGISQHQTTQRLRNQTRSQKRCLVLGS
jgi:hypothetical protein